MTWGLQQWGLDPWGGVTLEPPVPERVFKPAFIDPTLGLRINLSVRIERSIQDTQFVLDLAVFETENIDKELFVFDTCKQTYSHIATVRDLDLFTTSFKEAEERLAPFYRLASLHKEFSTVQGAIAFETLLEQRLQILVALWKPVLKDYLSTDIFTATG